MQFRAFVAAMLGLALFAPLTPAIAQSAPDIRPLELAQAPKDDDDASAEDEKKRRPQRDERRTKGGKDAAQQSERSTGEKSSRQGEDKTGKNTAQQNEKSPAEKPAERGEDKGGPAKSATDTPAKGNAPAGARAPATQSEEKNTASGRDDSDDSRRGPASARSREDDKGRSGASGRERAGDDDDNRRGRPSSKDDDSRRNPAAAQEKGGDDRRAPSFSRDRDDDDNRRGPSFSRERNDEERDNQRGPSFSRDREGDDSRRGPSFSRNRGDDDDDRRRSFERMREWERERTSREELSRREIRGDRPTEIDGGRRMLRRDGDRIVIRTDDSERFRHWHDGRGDHRVERLPNGRTRTVVVYPDGSQIVTVTGPRGEIIHRSRRDPRGREIVLIREVQRPPLAQIDLGPLRLSIPREQYVVDSRRASRQDLRTALVAPPVEPVERIYSLEEVRQFERVRDKMRRIDITSITFDTDSAVITQDQAAALEELAAIIGDLIERNPAEVFLIEGHTDLVGSDVYNLALSDRRAEAVAIALTDYFDIPPENLVTQGYGEAFPKIPTEASERENRRVAVRRITPLVAGN